MRGLDYSGYILLLITSGATAAFLPEVQMPYDVISSGTVEQSKLNSTLTCDEQRNSLQDCTAQCYSRSQNGIKYYNFKITYYLLLDYGTLLLTEMQGKVIFHCLFMYCLPGSGCPGFYSDTTQSNTCYICHVSNITEVQVSLGFSS